MKETYKIYLIFWGPFLVIIFLTILFLLNYKKTFSSVPEIKLSANYIEVINELNNLTYLKPFKLLEKEEIIIDPFTTGLNKDLLKGKTTLNFKPLKIFHLSIIYIEGKKKICIINGNRFTEGDNLTKEIKIQKIGDYYVDLQINNKKIKRLFLGQTLSF